MPKVNFVKKARKNYPTSGIRKGQSYYWWKFRYGGINRSKVRPKPSQLTQSEYLGRMYSLEETCAEISVDDGIETVVSELEQILDELREIADEQEEKRNNMPDQLQDSDTGSLLEARHEACENMISNLEEIRDQINDLEGDNDELAPQIKTIMESISWEFE